MQDTLAHNVVPAEGTTITDTHEVETPRAQQRSQTVTAQADLLVEYVASSAAERVPWASRNYIDALPIPSDELMRDFGTRIYDLDMPYDPQVYSTLSILVMAVLAQGVKLEPAAKPDDPNYEPAVRVRDFCQFCLDNTVHAFPGIVYELVEGMLKMGHKVGEKIYEQRDVTIGGKAIRKAIVLADIKNKPHEATAFVVDGKMNVLGLLYVEPGASMPMFRATSMADAGTADDSENRRPRLIPRDKFVIPTHKPRNGDPRGTSHLRAVYTPWWKKQMWNPQHVAYVTRFAQPSAVAKLPPEAKDIPVRDSNTGQIKSYKSIVQATNDALAKIKSGAVASFVNTDVNLLESKSDGQVIFSSYDHEDRQIAKGVLMQTLTTEEAEHMARAAGAIHQDVFGLFLQFLRDIVEWVFRFELCKPIVLYNFGEEEADTLTPHVSLGEAQVQDIPKLMCGISQMALAGLIHRSMYPGIRTKVDLPPANADQEEADYQEQKAQQQAMAEAAKQGARQAETEKTRRGEAGNTRPQDQPSKPKPKEKPSK